MRLIARLLYAWHRRRYRHRWADLDRAARGRIGERVAGWYLRAQGLGFICANWQHRHHELDLVMRDRDVLVFVEVRTRPADAAVPGYESLTRDKRQSVHAAAEAYRRRLPRPANHWRFDVVEVNVDAAGVLSCRHFANSL